MFKNGHYATVWGDAVDVKNRAGDVIGYRFRLSSSRKAGEDDSGKAIYKQDFGGFCDFLFDCKDKAVGLKERDRIKLLDVGVSNNYSKEHDKTYYNHTVYDFEMAEGFSGAQETNTVSESTGGDLPF